MKKSASVSIGLLATMALAVMVGCDDTNPNEEVRRCVDANNVVVDDAKCNITPQQNASVGNGGGGTTVIYPYHWYYGGAGGWQPGAVVTGGRTTPTPGFRAVSPTSMGSFSGTRGGFGGYFGVGE